MVRTLRAELGTEHGTVKRVAEQLGYGLESVRLWVRQADIDDGHAPGVTTDEAARVRALEQEVRELRRANEILKRAASFFGAELDRQHRSVVAFIDAHRDDVVEGRKLGVEPICTVLRAGCRWPRAPTTRPRPAHPRPGRAVTRS